MNCKYCRASCTGAGRDRELAMCLGYDPPKNNADRIRAMDDIALARQIAAFTGYEGNPEEVAYWLDWLRKEITDESPT